MRDTAVDALRRWSITRISAGALRDVETAVAVSVPAIAHGSEDSSPGSRGALTS